MRSLLAALLVLLPAQDPAPAPPAPAPPAPTTVPNAKFDALLDELREVAAIADGTARLAAFDALAKRLGVGPKPVEGRGKWSVQATVNPLDDSRSVVLSLEAEKESTIRLKGDLLPQLVLRCKHGELDAYVITGQPAAKEKEGDKETGKATVTLRFDKEPAFDLPMDPATDGEALFWPDPAGAVESVAKAERMLFVFAKADGNSALVAFDLRGFDLVQPELAQACASKKK